VKAFHVRSFDIWSLLAFLLPLSLYLWCLAPSITFYDSGEFVTATHLLGSAHSPGYPLFILYAKPFTWLPFANIAFRVNLATAVSAALACLVLFLIVRNLLKEIPFCDQQELSDFVTNLAALSGALVFATTPRLWLQSNHDKPYPLLTVLTALMLLFLFRWRDAYSQGEEQPSWWYAAAFLAGLASGAHQTIVLLVPGCLFFVLVTAPGSVRRVREWLLTVAMLLAGGIVQLYLPLRAAAGARQNWGDPSVFSRFLWHILRRGYPQEHHGRDISLLLKQLGGFDIPHEFGWVGLLLVFVGIWSCWCADRAFLLYVMISLVSFWLMIAGYFNPQADVIFLTEEFYTPLYLLAAILFAIGLFTIAARGAAAAQTPEKYGVLHRLLLFLFFMLIPLTQLVINWGEQDQHKNYLAQDYAVNTLRPLPDDAVLFTWGDSGAFPLWYLQGVERMREDLDLPHIPHVVFPWYQHEFPRLAQAFKGVGSDRAEVYFTHMAEKTGCNRFVFMDFSTRYALDWHKQQPVQQGIVYWVGPVLAEAPDDGSIWERYTLQRLVPQGWMPDMDSKKALQIYAYSLMQSAEDLARHGHMRESGRLLDLAGDVMPEWQENLKQIQRRYAISGAAGGSDEQR
jgi:4-amino-4-deoxy-L-arabinose transferase-like glycosyltransferase